MDAKSVYSSSSSGFRTPPPYSHTHISFAASTKASTQSQGLRPASSNQSSSPPVMVGSPTTTTSSMAKSAGGSPRITSSTSTGNKAGQVSSLLSQQAKNSPTVPSSWSPSSKGSLPLFRLQQQEPRPSLHGFSQREHDITFFNPLTFIVGPNDDGKIIISCSTRYISCVPPVLLLFQILVSSHDVHTSKIQSQTSLFTSTASKTSPNSWNCPCLINGNNDDTFTYADVELASRKVASGHHKIGIHQIDVSKLISSNTLGLSGKSSRRLRRLPATWCLFSPQTSQPCTSSISPYPCLAPSSTTSTPAWTGAPSCAAPLDDFLCTYEDLVDRGDEGFEWVSPSNEWVPMTLNYTSGTTSSPKGVVHSHRGVFIIAVDSLIDWGVPKQPVYL
ncbi:hypothetical protein ACFX13_001476 [Malus domestica]